MRRALILIGALVGLQALLLALWWGIEEGRGPPLAPVEQATWTLGLNLPAPPLDVEGPDGSRAALRTGGGQPLILHFWATWCPPCRAELPALMAFAEASDREVLAVSLDEGWGPIEELLGPGRPESLARAEAAEVSGAFGVTSLPVTLIIDGRGVIRGRVDGPVDWASDDEVARLE